MQEDGKVTICLDTRCWTGRTGQILNNRVIIDGKQVFPAAHSTDAETTVAAVAGRSGILIETATITCQGPVQSVETQSSNVEIYGTAGSVRTQSGDVTVGASVQGSITTMSGTVRAKTIHGNVSTMSGDVTH